MCIFNCLLTIQDSWRRVFVLRINNVYCLYFKKYFESSKPKFRDCKGICLRRAWQGEDKEKSFVGFILGLEFSFVIVERLLIR